MNRISQTQCFSIKFTHIWLLPTKSLYKHCVPLNVHIETGDIGPAALTVHVDSMMSAYIQHMYNVVCAQTAELILKGRVSTSGHRPTLNLRTNTVCSECKRLMCAAVKHR